MDFTFKTIAEFNDFFKDEKTCYDFLENQLWQGVPVCPHCGSLKTPYKVKARGKFTDIPSYRCSERACDLPFTVRTGSIFEGSKVELRKWLQSAYEISISKKGISSVELATRIGVSQKTAWFINHRLRAMLTEANPDLLSGTVEADETYVGGKGKNRHANKKTKPNGEPIDKTMVLGIIERGGRIRTKVIPDTGKGTMHTEIVDNVAKDAEIITDGHQAYKGLQALGYEKHTVVKVNLDSYITDRYFHTNNIEGYWSILKRGIIGTFHVVSPKHLQKYCDEFAHRFNTRGQSTVERFAESIKSANKARITYKKLTESKTEIA